MTSRYAQPCPVCGAIILPKDIPWKSVFTCPGCGEELKIDSKYTPWILAVSFLTGPMLSWLLGYEGSMFVIVAAGVTLPLLLLGILLGALVFVPGYKQAQFSKDRPFDRVASLRLTKKHNGQDKTDS